MNSQVELLQKYKKSGGVAGSDTIHATLTGYPDRTGPLKRCIESLVGQVDTLHVFLNGFDDIPGFLEHEKIFITRSQDFGDLGECGKYYWTDDLEGYHFICSDRLVYPGNYVSTMIPKMEGHERKAVIGAGGFVIRTPFRNFSDSTVFLSERQLIAKETPVSIINDQALAYHSSTIKVSRHYFYQPWLSAFWFSIIGKEQHIPLICCDHPVDWIVSSPEAEIGKNEGIGPGTYQNFLIKSFFIPEEKEIAESGYSPFNAYFDKVWVMNLDRRPDRWNKIKQTATHFNLKISRFSAVDGSRGAAKSDWEHYFSSDLLTLPGGIEPLSDYKDKFLKYHHYKARVHFMETKLRRKAIQSPGAWGYALSYIKIIKNAIEKDYRRILIFDDDIILHHAFNAEFDRHIRELPPDWKLIMLGAMQHYWEPHITKVKDLFYHGYGSSVASHAVGIDRKMFLPLLYYAEKMNLPIDEGAIFHIQNVYPDQCFIFLPNLAIQDMGESDINSSKMGKDDVEKWVKLFRWDPGRYYYPKNIRLKKNVIHRFFRMLGRTD